MPGTAPLPPPSTAQGRDHQCARPWHRPNARHHTNDVIRCPPTLRGINDKLKHASAAVKKAAAKVDAAHRHFTALSVTAPAAVPAADGQRADGGALPSQHGKGRAVVIRDASPASDALLPESHGPMLRQASFALEFLETEDAVLKRLVHEGTDAKERMANAAIAQRNFLNARAEESVPDAVFDDAEGDDAEGDDAEGGGGGSSGGGCDDERMGFRSHAGTLGASDGGDAGGGGGDDDDDDDADVADVVVDVAVNVADADADNDGLTGPHRCQSALLNAEFDDAFDCFWNLRREASREVSIRLVSRTHCTPVHLPCDSSLHTGPSTCIRSRGLVAGEAPPSTPLRGNPRF